MIWMASRFLVNFSGQIAAAVLALFAAARAEACEMSASGSMLTISGEILPGDEFKFRELVKHNNAVTTLSLNSPGGDIISAGEIGRQVRAAGLTTVVDAAQQACASSCTIIFAGGHRRIYLHAQRVGGVVQHEGFRGLGFHQGSEPGLSGHKTYSKAGTDKMMALYQELGVPNAAGLVNNSPPESIYGLSATMARALGIATHI